MNEFQQWAERYSGLAEQLGRTATDAQGEAIVTRGALEAVLVLHRDAYGYCTHCRCPHRCPTVAAIETGSQQAREELWRRVHEGG